jgi:hypothetical protein
METIEVVGLNMQCFKVRADTLEPLSSSSYYEPAAWRDPRGRQMGIGEWQRLRADQWDREMREARHRSRSAEAK